MDTGYFHILAIVTNAVINIPVQASVWSTHFQFFSIYTWEWSHKVILYLTFEKRINTIFFSSHAHAEDPRARDRTPAWRQILNLLSHQGTP